MPNSKNVSKLFFCEIVPFAFLTLITILFFVLDQAKVSTTFISTSIFHPLFQISLAGICVLYFSKIIYPFYQKTSESTQFLLQELCVPLLFIGFTFYHFGHLLWGDFPSTYDHTTHILRAALTEDALFSIGSILPWTSAIGAGVPLNDLYPPGYTLLTILIHFLCFFQISIYTAYTLTVFVSWFIFLGGLYTTARVWFGKTAGLIAVTLLYFDPGFIGLSGWQESFSVGLGSMVISNGFWLWSILLFSIYLRSKNPSILIRASLSICIMAALLCHTITMLSLPVSLIIIFFIHRINQKQSNNPAHWDSWLWVALGFGLSAWWWLPFMTSREWVLPFGTEIQQGYTAADQIFKGTLFTNTPPLFMLLGFAGSIWGFSHYKKIIPTALSLMYWFFIIINQDVFLQWFYSETLTDYTQQIPLFRFMLYSKLCGFILTGAMLQDGIKTLCCWLFKHPQEFFKLSTGETHMIHWYSTRMSTWLFALFCLLPLYHLSGNIHQVYVNNYTTPDYPVKTIEQFPPYAKSMDAMIEDLPKIEFDQQINPAFLLPFCRDRIGIQTNMYESMIPLLYGYGITPSGYMPTMLLKTRLSNFEPQVPAYGMTQYSVVHGAFYNTLIKISPATLIEQQGDLSLLKHVRYRDEYPVYWQEPGKEQPDLIEQSYGYVKVNITDTEKPSLLRLGISRYRKWKAYLDGNPVPIQEYISQNESFDAGKYISVEVNNGTLELRYELEWIDWFAYTFAWFTIVIWIILLLIPYSVILKVLSQINAPIFWLYPYCLSVGLFLILANMIVLSIFQPIPPTHFWYAGYKSNQVGTLDFPPDDLLDIEFGLLLGHGCIGNTNESITMKEILPEPLNPSVNQWTTSYDPVWKIAVKPLDQPKNQRNSSLFPLIIEQPMRLRLFAGNPYHHWFGINNGDYIPSQAQIECTLHFSNGSKYILKSPLRPQGHK